MTTPVNQRPHVPGCALRGATLEGPRGTETMDAWARRVATTRCTCRRTLADAIVMVLRPFAGQRPTAGLRDQMQQTVDAYLRRVHEKYGDNGWSVSLTLKEDSRVKRLVVGEPGAAVEVHLVPPAEAPADQQEGPSETVRVAAPDESPLAPHIEAELDKLPVPPQIIPPVVRRRPKD